MNKEAAKLILTGWLLIMLGASLLSRDFPISAGLTFLISALCFHTARKDMEDEE